MRRVIAILVVVLATTAWAVPSRADSKAQRSAQSDCQREVARRGYTVVSTRNYQQYKDGWSLDIQARDYKGRTTWGTCFVDTRSGDVSLSGFGWGGSGSWGDGGSNQAFTFYCGSPDYKYRECQLPVDGRARLTKKKSDARCVEGKDWGQRGDRVWVDNGCRAKFEVVRWSGGGGSNNNHGQQQRAEAQCRNEARRQGLVVQNVTTPRYQGSYWEANVYGTRNGWKLSARCRYYPKSNHAELKYTN